MLMTTLKTLNSPISHAWNVMTKKSSRNEGGNGVSWLDVARVYVVCEDGCGQAAGVRVLCG